MDKTVRVFRSHREAEAADRAYYRSLTPKERLDILLQIIEDYNQQHGQSAEGFARVCRVIKRGKR